ncbi:UDP-N-acetylmuramate dehydrogenase [Urechidicola croceus]|uniref:UDP-N-acetylenolpyruvoylglucosamine reductase n=1 Tax=Urechidicola croceus TaxID=1850246 RepID=A0A1D8P631_9FLAO|nr:UDP-N-acetylmuramate dehydrogenase [Urechidicola croceus]AOW20025.1 UDP-N-acetylenolpyruvoylglucosamine reductase [Urechidicola croceus]
MNIQKNISLKPFNTFGVDVNASKFLDVKSISDLREVLLKNHDVFILSGGSNLLFTKDIDKLVLHLNLKGIEVIKETNKYVYVKSQAGENWHEFVLWCIENGFGGLENLSLIPGNVGTSPIQNIGAYGVEIKDTFHKLKAIEINTGKRRVFKKKECNFGYRNSVFKNELKGKYIITSVIFKLRKKNHKLNTSYGAIQAELDNRGIDKPTIKDVSNVVIDIRNSKLPNPKEIGNSGSFFKNPVIAIDHFINLKNEYPNIPSYIISDLEIKVPAGWLIEQCGFKGKRFGNAGIHEKQALVLVNYGNATGKEVYQIAQNIQEAVKEKFEISLEIEVNVI